MKKIISLYPVSMDTRKAKNGSNRLNIVHLLLAACIAFLSMFLLTSNVQAQTTTNPSLTTQFKQDETHLNHDKKMVREVREEKQQLKELNNIPDAIMQKFNANFPKAQNVAWSVPANYVQVDFTSNGKHRAAYYDYNNHLIGTSHFLSYSMLPENGRARIAKDYKGYTPVKTMFYDDNEDNDLNMILFDMPIEKDSYFVQLKNGAKQIVVQVDTNGEVSYFSDLK